MAKRGEVRPWRLSFKWENGVKGTLTFSTFDETMARAAEIRDTAEHNGMSVDIKTNNRNDQEH